MDPATNAAPERKPRWGDEFEFRFERLDERGNSVGTCGEYTAHERGGPIGARVRARVISRRREDLEVRTLEVLEPGPEQVPARCAHHGTCGGCTFQDLEYGAQLRAKLEAARGILREAGLTAEVREVIPCAEPWNYRNKMDFTFGTKRWLDRAEPSDIGADGVGTTLGLFPRGFHSKILEIEECHIAFAGAGEIVRTARRLAREQGLDAYDSRAHSGWLRHLVLRKSWSSGELLACLVSTDESPERANLWVRALLAAHPEITTLVQLVNSGRALVAVGEREIRHHGRGTITERIAGNEFEIGATTFFQVNTPQAERLFELVLEFADVRAGEVVHDLYCGIGAITLALARRAPATDRTPNVLGFELVDAAITAARAAALANNLQNTRFTAGDVLATWREAQMALPADVIVVDPPRAGIHPKVLAALASASARRIVMVSCELRSGARDGAILLAAGWKLVRVAALDLFPHTPHLECVMCFERAP